MDNKELTTKPVEVKEISPFQQAADLVHTYAREVMADQRAAEYWTQLSVMAKQNDKIRLCTPDSIITGMLACIRLDLMPNTPEQKAFLIPFKNKLGQYELQLQVGYKGLKDLAYRTGVVKILNGELVFAGDTFEVEYGSERKLIHKPNFTVNRTDFSNVTHVYITAKLNNGETAFYVMTKDEIEKIREDAKKRNFGKDSPAWAYWWDQQALKTALKRATKQLPSSTKDNRLQIAAEWDSWASANKLTHQDGNIVEGQEITDEELAEVRKRRMEAAADERKVMTDSKFTPGVVQPFYEGDESQEPPAPTNPNYAEVGYADVKQQVANTESDQIPCDYPGCSSSQTAEFSAICTSKYGKTLCKTHWGMTKKGEIDPKGEWPEVADEVTEGAQS